MSVLVIFVSNNNIRQKKQNDKGKNRAKNGDLFAYIKSDIVINNTIYGVRVSIKKKVGSNVFWIHHIDTKKIPVYSTLPERRNLKRTEILK
mgnify:CR=1 FL=1